MDMLQDYASDDDDNTTTTTIAPAAPAPEPAAPAAASSSATPIPPAAPLPAPSSLLLPSAAELFDAAPPARNKRPQVNGSAHPSQHQPKVARSSSSSSAPRTPPGATLVPPQLRGRSNVATEDLDKLFVQRQQRRSE